MYLDLFLISPINICTATFCSLSDFIFLVINRPSLTLFPIYIHIYSLYICSRLWALISTTAAQNIYREIVRDRLPAPVNLSSNNMYGCNIPSKVKFVPYYFCCYMQDVKLSCVFEGSHIASADTTVTVSQLFVF